MFSAWLTRSLLWVWLNLKNHFIQFMVARRGCVVRILCSVLWIIRVAVTINVRINIIVCSCYIWDIWDIWWLHRKCALTMLKWQSEMLAPPIIQSERPKKAFLWCNEECAFYEWMESPKFASLLNWEFGLKYVYEIQVKRKYKIMDNHLGLRIYSQSNISIM